MRPSLMSPTRVLLTTDTVGGVWTYTLDLARQLVRGGLEVELAVLGPPPSLDQQHEAAAIAGLRLVMLDLPLDWMADDARTLREASRTFFALCRRMDVDIVHLNSPGLATAATGDIPLVVGLHSCVATWWNAVHPQEPLPADLAWRSAEIGQGLAAADMVVVPSRAFGTAARETYSDAAPVHVIHNGRDLPAVEPVTKEPDIVLTAGRLWDKAKNVAMLDEAAAMLPMPVFAAGPTEAPQPHGPAFENRNLKLLGKLPTGEMRSWLGRSSVFVTSALYEPFGLGVLEAAQARCALVLSDIPTFRELWEGAALFVGSRDAAGFAEAIRTLAADEAARIEMAEAAFHRSGRYSLEAMSAETLRLYAHLAQRAAPIEEEVA